MTTTASCESAVDAVHATAAAAAASVLAALGPTRVHQVARHQRRQECTSRVAGLPAHSFAVARKQVRDRCMTCVSAQLLCKVSRRRAPSHACQLPPLY